MNDAIYTTDRIPLFYSNIMLRIQYISFPESIPEAFCIKTREHRSLRRCRNTGMCPRCYIPIATLKSATYFIKGYTILHLMD